MPVVKIFSKVMPISGSDLYFRSMFSSSSLFSGLQLTDLRFRCGSSTEICAHQARFASVSPFLNSIFRQRFIVLSNGVQKDPDVTVILDPIFAEPLKVLIELLYCGRSFVTDIGVQDPELLKLCRILGIESLKLESELLNDDGEDLNDEIELLNDDGEDVNDEIEGGLRKRKKIDEDKDENRSRKKLKIVDDRGRWNCLECSDSFRWLESLEEHLKKCPKKSLRLMIEKCSDDDDENRGCKKCGKNFRYRIGLMKHSLSCNGRRIEDSEKSQKGEVCPVCSQKFSNLNMHAFKHFFKELEDLLSKKGISLSSNRCELCGKAFYNRADLLKHYALTHKMIRKFLSKPQQGICKYVACCQCDVKFSDKQKLKNHLANQHFKNEILALIKERELIVNGGKCAICKSVCSGFHHFAVSHKFLKNFLSADYAEFLFEEVDKCAYCKRQDFLTVESYKTHLISHFQNQMRAEIRKRSFSLKKCEFCNRDFKMKQSGVIHYAIKHKLLAPLLNKSLAEKLFVTNQSASLSFECDICQKLYPTKAAFQRHAIFHFRTQILEQIKKRTPGVCFICNAHMDDRFIIRHFAIIHRLLDPYLSENMAKVIFSREKAPSSSASSSLTSSSCHSKVKNYSLDCIYCDDKKTTLKLLGLRIHLAEVHLRKKLEFEINRQGWGWNSCSLCKLSLSKPAMFHHYAFVHLLKDLLPKDYSEKVFPTDDNEEVNRLESITYNSSDPEPDKEHHLQKDFNREIVSEGSDTSEGFKFKNDLGLDEYCVEEKKDNEA